MTIRNRNILIATVLLCASLVWEGCGGKQHKPAPGTPGNKQSVAVSSQEVLGTHIHAVQTTQKVSLSTGWSFLPEVHAQSTTVVAVQQDWSGRCEGSPQVVNNAGISSAVVFGVGQTADDNCEHEQTDGDSTGQQSATNAISGQLVFGDGTLSNLIANTERGTTIVSSAGIPVHVWARRGANILDTGISCTLPAGGDELICKSTGTFAAKDGDRILITYTFGVGDSLHNLHVLVTKALP